MPETLHEQFDRIAAMAGDDGETWDHSPNDLAALKSAERVIALARRWAEANRIWAENADRQKAQALSDAETALLAALTPQADTGAR